VFSQALFNITNTQRKATQQIILSSLYKPIKHVNFTFQTYKEICSIKFEKENVTIPLLQEETRCTEVDPVALSGDYKSTTSFKAHTGNNPDSCFLEITSQRHHLKLTLAITPTAAPSVKSHSACRGDLQRHLRTHTGE
jgi:hypothetical protein